MTGPAVPSRAAGQRSLFQGWWVAGAAAMVAFSQVAFWNPVLGIFIGPLQDEFGWSRATIAGALATGTVVGAAMSPLVGPLVDRHGGRSLLVGAVSVMAICLVLLGTVSTVWQFYGYFAVGRAAVVGIVDLAVGVTIANWFIRLRGRATSVVLLGTRAGMALMPLLVLLFLTVADWRLAFVGLGVLVAAVAMLPAWLVIRRRPEDVGLLPDGGPTTADPIAGTAVAPPRDDDPRWPVRDVVRTSAFWFLLFGTGLLFFTGGAVNLSIAPHIEDNGLSRTTAATVITVWALAGMVGGIIGGELRQSVPVRYALPPILVFTAGGLVWLILVQETWMAYVFAVWHGLSFGAQLPLMLVAFPDYFGRWTVGAIRGIAAPVQFGLNAVGPLVASLAFDRWGTYDYVFTFFVGCYFLAGLAILLAKPPSLPTPVGGPEEGRP